MGYDLLTVAKTEIGANRKHRSNRFLTLIQYCLDMALVFKELLRVCRPHARIIIVVGRESMVRGVAFLNGQLVTELAYHLFGLDLRLRQDRCFRNRFGQDIYEDILHFEVSRASEMPDLMGKARLIAQSMLMAAQKDAPPTTQPDLTAAIDRASQVEPSPAFDPGAAHKVS